MYSIAQELSDKIVEIFKNSYDYINLHDEEGNILDVNNTIINKLGYTKEELLNMNISDLVMDMNYLELSNATKETFKTGNASKPRIVKLRNKAGNFIYIKGSATPLTKKGKVYAILGIGHDVTEFVIFKEKFKEIEARYKSLIEQTTDAVFCFEYDPPIPIDLPIEEQVRLLYNCVLVECNIVYAQSYGYSNTKDVIGRRLADLFGISSDLMNKLFKDMIAGGYNIVDRVGTEKLSNGEERYFLNNGHGVIESNKLYCIWGTFRDITDRKKAEEKLLEIKEFYKKILDGIINGVWVTDADDIIFYSNKGMELISGISAKQIVDSRVLKDFPESTLKYFRPYYLKAKETLKPVFYDAIPVITPTGRPSSQSGWLIPMIKDHKYDGIICTVDDVTKRKKAELRLKESEEKWRALSENSPAHIMLYDLDQNILFINRTVPDLSKEDVIGKSVYNFIPKEYHQIAKDSFKRVIETGKPCTYTLEYITKEGDSSFFDVWIGPIFEAGKIIALISSDSDITERKQAELKLSNRTTELIESELKYRNMIANLDIGYYNTDMDGVLIFHNQSFNRIIGYKPSENLTGLYIPDFWKSSQDREDYLKTLLEDQKITHYIVSIKKKNNEEVIVEFNSHLVDDEKGRILGIEGTIADVTNKFKLEQSLKEQNLRLNETIDSKTDLLRRTSHELRTPLTSIKGFTLHLLENLNELSSNEIISYLKDFSNELLSLEDIIESLSKSI